MRITSLERREIHSQQLNGLSAVDRKRSIGEEGCEALQSVKSVNADRKSVSADIQSAKGALQSVNADRTRKSVNADSQSAEGALHERESMEDTAERTSARERALESVRI